MCNKESIMEVINNLKLGKTFFVVFSVCVLGSIESVEGNLPQNKSNACDEEIWSGYSDEDMTVDEYQNFSFLF